MNQQSAASDDLLFEMHDGIGKVTFNRPQARNAFTFEMYERLAQICEQADGDHTIKVLVFQAPATRPSPRVPTSINSAPSPRRNTRSSTSPASIGF